MTVDRLAHAALLIVDMQNDFVRVGAPLEVPQARETITVHRELIAFCRERDIPVLYTKFVAGPGRTLIWESSLVLGPPICCCWKEHLRYYDDVGKELDGSDIISEIYPEPADPIVEKFGYGSFHNTNLDDLLRARHVESLFVTGTVTQICVEETAREAFKRGYKTTIVSDADNYAQQVSAKLVAAGIRVETDLRNEKINYKVREHSLAKVPLLLVVGKREAEEGTVALRPLGADARQDVLKLEDAVARLVDEAVPPDLRR